MSAIKAPKLEVNGVAFIIVGSFNPAIFQPFWFSKNGLLPDDEANSAKVEIIHRDATVFTTGWYKQEVTTERFVLESYDAMKLPALRDLLVGTFALLEHTPLKKLGLNTMRHYRMANESDWHKVGDHFAPKESWRALFDEGSRIGLRSLTVSGPRVESKAKDIQITLQPSDKVQHGVFINVHHYFDLQSDDKVSGNFGQRLSELVKDSWDDFTKYTDLVCNHIFVESAME